MSEITPFQPSFSVIDAPTEAELVYIDEQPPGIFPDNPDSNFGIRRRIFTNQIQQVADQTTMLYNERFVVTSDELLDHHEFQMGLPVSPAGKTLAQRRAEAAARYTFGAFTRTKRREVVEKYITATFGSAPQLTPAGIALSPGGVPLYGDANDLTGLYAIVEDIEDFSYEVRIKNTITPDEDALRRELDRITPAHISYTISYVAIP